MTRRSFSASLAGAAAATLSAQSAPRTTMGVATTCYLSAWRPKDMFEFLEHCNGLGAGGVQLSITTWEPEALKKFRARAEQLGMYIEIFAGLPRDPASADQFERTIKAAKDLGALCARSACLGGRRYETFNTLADWKKFVADSKAGVERGVSIVEKHKFPWALENHKDWTVDEFVALLKQYSSEYLGTCVDTGNNIALLDDPMELVEKLAPYAFSTHIKDMDYREYTQGFLLSEVVFGTGALDIPKMIRTIQQARPKVRMTLEMITRDPLKVTCLTSKYWETFPDRNGKYLAAMLDRVRSRKPERALPKMEGLDRAGQLKFENDNVKLCLDYARQNYGLA
ncbi:MAG: TIM barrel protein [Acidobacteria bacterium]|nr:TIM barrel protein [Acidobacteriota bacterium]